MTASWPDFKLLSIPSSLDGPESTPSWSTALPNSSSLFSLDFSSISSPIDLLLNGIGILIDATLSNTVRIASNETLTPCIDLLKKSKDLDIARTDDTTAIATSFAITLTPPMF